MVAYSPSETHSCGRKKSPYPASHNFNDNVTKDSSDLPTFATCTEIRRHGQSGVFFQIDGMYTPLKSHGWNMTMSPWKRKLPYRKPIHFGGSLLTFPSVWLMRLGCFCFMEFDMISTRGTTSNSGSRWSKRYLIWIWVWSDASNLWKMQ